MSTIQVAMVGITGMLIALQFKEVKKEYAVFIMLIASILVFSFGISKLGQIFKTIDIISDRLKISAQYIEVLLKIVGIAFICEFSSDICKDSGFGAVANQIQMFGKLSILVVSLPVFLNLIDLIGGLV
ncbi:MAG: SpoIIIAC/SpoIIIAD family protein [Lachnospiraceae bacterium]|nr:stage III sporulation AC/AD family protein [Clostridiales bacterium]MDD6294335.1 SpoIIIAC/SpoIIIAD family protein [Eubacteriales bacterium]MDY2606486.1 SpoIIIAC/SpoIIIAD family protein [Lachnospiraceae bacterium]